MKKYTVCVNYIGVEEGAFSYEQEINKQVCERFERVVNDKKLASTEVEICRNGVWETFDDAGKEDRENKGDRLVFFDMPGSDVRITAKYEVDESRVKMRPDLTGVREVVTKGRFSSYFYSAKEDVNGDTHDIDEGKTYYYDAGEEMTFVLRLNVDADVVLTTGKKEYSPVKKEKRVLEGQAVYEYTFGFVDEFDPAWRGNEPVRLYAPETIISFRIR